MNLRGFLRQRVEWRRKTGVDEWQRPAYAAPETIPARKEEKLGRRRGATATEPLALISAETSILVIEAIELGDLIDGEEVRRVEAIVDVGGRTLGYSAYLVSDGG